MSYYFYGTAQYKNSFDLSKLRYRGECTLLPKDLRLNSAADAVLQYIKDELFVPQPSRRAGSSVTYSGLAGNGSLVVLEGLKPKGKVWRKACVTVTNMQEKDDKLVRILKRTVIEEVKGDGMWAAETNCY